MFLGSKQKRRDREIADQLYTRIVDASRQPDFFVEFGVPDTLDGRFEMVSLHMFVVLQHLVDGDAADKALAQNIMESFVRDMDNALRELVSDIRVPERMKTLYESFGGRIAGYTVAASEGGEAVHAALARNVFPDGGQAEHVIAIAEYLQAALSAIAGLKTADVAGGRFQFPDPAGFSPATGNPGGSFNG